MDDNKGLIIRERIRKLRELMLEHNIDAYLIVSDDYHASEYVGEYFKCREYISGFSGSAGTVIVTHDEAVLWTDGRYFIQAQKQLEDTGIYLFRQGEKDVPDIYKYLKKKLKSGQTIGFDGRTVTTQVVQKLEDELNDKNIKICTKLDLVGIIFENRPEFPKNKVWQLDEKYCGESVESKLFRLRKKIEELHADSILLASLDDIAWLFNIRGSDVLYTPVVMAYSYVSKDDAILYVAKIAIDDSIMMKFLKVGINVRDYFSIYDDLKKIAPDSTIFVDKSSVNYELINCIPDSVKIVEGNNPTILFKAVKNETEINNERLAHIKDAVAVTKLIYLLKNDWKTKIENQLVTELDVSNQLLQLRKQQEGFITESFASIIATGEHGAIVHYEPDSQTDIPIMNNSFLLMDTGGHYLWGTTDVTRTIAIGEVSGEQKRNYTAVLKGNLNLSAAHFKKGCTGENIDYLARSPLWEYGLDYNHGTGHGVGYLLNVHEGPNAIRLRNANGKSGQPFIAGMITSNEPGVYLEGEYGIRLENLVLCVEDKKNSEFLEFETLTKIPFDRDAIDETLLDDKQIVLLNNYHKGVYETLSVYLSDKENEWLKKVCAPF